MLVDDVEAHFSRARHEGATMLSEIENGGPGRLYRVAGIEGHRWMFLQKKP
ncbi:MAG TPA: hypothetical protein VFP71_13025 [Candidatus Angelobacter sp.]|nr:hypothetical protein [Candidatus Angelobacter sp.]